MRPQQPLLLALPLLLFLGRALVVLLLSFRQTHADLHAPAHVMKIEGNERVAGAIDLADQPADFLGVQQEPSRTDRVGINVR